MEETKGRKPPASRAFTSSSGTNGPRARTRPLRRRRTAIPKDRGRKVRALSIPAIRDRGVSGALKLLLEPIFEADCQPGSYGYRPKQLAHQAVDRAVKAVVQGKTHVLDLDPRSYFDNVRRDRLLAKVARRGVWRPQVTPKRQKRTPLLRELKDVFRRSHSQPIGRGIPQLNPMLRGWVNYCAIGNSRRCFSYLRAWVEQQRRRHLMRAQNRPGLGGGRGGVGGGSPRRAGCIVTTAFGPLEPRRKRSPPERSHDPWGEASRKAECGESARSV